MSFRKFKRRVIVSIIVLVVAIIVCACNCTSKKPNNPPESDHSYTSSDIVKSDFSVHMPELGNKYAGDCTLIKSGDTEILIDAGSKTSSIDAVTSYIDKYCEDKILEYVIVTHAHEDHYACFTIEDGSIFDLYECKTIIDFSQVEKGKETQKMYLAYQSELNAEIDNGAVHYTASECIENGKSEFNVTDDVTLNILDSYYYHNRSSNENNHSVCVTVTYSANGNENVFLFTGDLEAGGEKKLLGLNPNLKDVYFYKAGHHGSNTSSCEEFLEVISPEVVFVGCVAGSPEYSDNPDVHFPSLEFCKEIAKYTDQVYVPSVSLDYKAGVTEKLNGDLVICYFKDSNSYAVLCSNNNTLLKDTSWYAEYRKDK